jgi:FtsH-binding integral membrane protein
MLRIAPAVIALSLGVIYAVGAITTYAQLKAVGINGVEAMALVPLDQILGQGIGRMVQKAGEAAVIAVFFGSGLALGMIVAFRAHKQKKEAQGQPLPLAARLFADPKKTTVVLAITGGVFAVLLFVFTPIDKAAAVVVALGVSIVACGALVYFLRDHIHQLSQAVALIIVGFLVYIVASTIAAAFLAPPPLPHLHLVTTSGATVDGGLVAESGSSWMVVRSNKSVTGINVRQVKRAFITYPPRPAEQTPLDWILDRPPGHGFPP